MGTWRVPVIADGRQSAISGSLLYASNPPIVWFWPIAVLLACVLAARRLRRPELDARLARMLAIAALIAFAIFVYAQLQRNLTHELDGSLRSTAATSMRFLGANRTDADRSAERPNIGRILALRGGTLPSPASVQPDTYLQVVDSSGTTFTRRPRRCRCWRRPRQSDSPGPGRAWSAQR